MPKSVRRVLLGQEPARRNRVLTWGDEATIARREARSRLRRPNAWTREHPRENSKPDPETGVAPGFTRCRNMRSRCRCSMCPAIHINSRSWLRSSSTHEPSDPPLRVVSHRRSSDDFVPAADRQRKQESGQTAAHQFDQKTVARKNKESSRAASPFKPGGISHTAGPAL